MELSLEKTISDLRVEIAKICGELNKSNEILGDTLVQNKETIATLFKIIIFQTVVICILAGVNILRELGI